MDQTLGGVQGYGAPRPYRRNVTGCRDNCPRMIRWPALEGLQRLQQRARRGTSARRPLWNESLLKLRPIYHWRERRERRVKVHIFSPSFLAFLLAKSLELKLRSAGPDSSIERALDALSRLSTTEQLLGGAGTGRAGQSARRRGGEDPQRTRHQPSQPGPARHPLRGGLNTDSNSLVDTTRVHLDNNRLNLGTAYESDHRTGRS